MQQNENNWILLTAVIGLGVVILLVTYNLLTIVFFGRPGAVAQTDLRATEVAIFVNATIAAWDGLSNVAASPPRAAAPTETPAPTRSPAPTVTATVADGPGIIAITGATITSEPVGDISEAAYLTEIASMSSGCQEGLYGIAEQTQRASSNTRMLLEDSWRTDMDKALLNIEQYCVGMSNISPVPPRFSTLHGYVALMSGEMEQMVDDFTYGVDNLDAERLVSATEHMSKGVAYVELMSKEMERLNR